MNLFHKSIAIAAVALSALGTAQAATTYLKMDPGTPGVANISFTLGSLTTGAGGFDDFFIFHLPDAQEISFGLTSDRIGPTFGAIFEGFALYDHSSGHRLDLVFNTGAPNSMSGGIYTLANGTYDLEIAGTYGSVAGGYTGYIAGTPAVPEPSGLALLLAGVGVTGLMVRRRKQQA